MNYLKTYFLACIVTLMLFVGVNWLVDPFGMFWSPEVSGLNTLKTEAGKRSRTIKPYRLGAVAPATLLIGNSRIEMGIAAESTAFIYQPVYNAGIPGLELRRQMATALEQIANNDNLKHIIVSVDYLDYLYREAYFLENPVPAPITLKTPSALERSRTWLSDRIALLASIDTMTASLATIQGQSGGDNAITRHGTNVADGYRTIMRWEGIKPLFKQKLAEVNKRLAHRDMTLYHTSIDENPGVTWLAQLLRVAREHDVTVDVFLSPYHYSYLHLIHDNDHWDRFEQWKTALANIPAIASGEVALWDFSVVNGYTTERVPLESPHTLMHWFWEPAHYRSELGELLLGTMLNGSAQSPAIGVRLEQDRVAAHHQMQTQALQATRDQWQQLQSGLKLTLSPMTTP